VRPRRSYGGWRFWLFVNNEILGIFSDLRICASRSPASGGSGLLALDFFGYFYARVLFVKVKALSLISGLVWVIDVRGLFCILYPSTMNAVSRPFEAYLVKKIRIHTPFVLI
jgi:hypothetical protein